MGFFSRTNTKKDATLSALVHSITDKENTLNLGKMLNINNETLPKFHLERIYLDCLAMDLAAHIEFGANTKKHSEVLDGVYDKLYKHYDGMGPEHAKHLIENISARLNVYSKIIRSCEDSDLQIAKAFAKYCEIDNDSQFIHFVQIYFIKQTNAFKVILSNDF